jgi:signal transduction histidine kinase
MGRSRSLVSWVSLAYSLFGIACSALLFALLRPNLGRFAFPDGFYLPLVLTGVSAVAAFAARSAVAYRAAQALRVLLLFCCCLFVVGCHEIEILLLSGVLLEVSLSEPYPANLVVTLSLSTALLLLRGAVQIGWGLSFGKTVLDQVGIAVCGCLASILGSRLLLFRETTIDLRAQYQKLENSVVELTRTLSRYQDYTVSERETAANQERKRITRDIHDIVGYTLTNNIMLMETARDLMQENPLGIPATIETARANAEEGLQRIRQAMYDLRLQETGYPRGVQAIHRLVSIFERSTGIEVRCEFGDVPRTFPDEVDSALYHLVQECLINSFRHGKAGHIVLLFRSVAGCVHVRIADDGVGSGPFQEGIGLRGMKERIGKLGGTIRAAGEETGFLVEATVPIGAQGDEPHDTHPHLR